MENIIWIELLKIVMALGVAGFTYFRYFHEGIHKQRVEFDIECENLNTVGDHTIIELSFILENKGHVEQYFNSLNMTIRAINPTPGILTELENHYPRLEFPIELARGKLIPDKYKPFFVRPGVKQRFPIVMRVPIAYSHIHVRGSFKYKNNNELHTAERAFVLLSQ